MKTCLIGLLCFFVSGLFAADPPATPLTQPRHARPDRVLTLKPLYTLDGDQAEGFFLKEPSAPVLLADGRMLLTDQDQLLLFDASGKLSKNLFKKGEGPGEWGYTLGVFTHDTGLAVMSMMPNKLLLFDQKFQFVREIRLETPQSMMRLISAGPTGARLFAVDLDFSRIKTGTNAQNHQLKRCDPAGKVSAGPLSFPQQVYSFVVKDKNRIMVQMELIDPFTFAPVGQTLLLAHQSDYTLKLVDLKTDQVTKVLTRAVKRQPWREAKGSDRPEGAPALTFFNDVMAIKARGDAFWVLSSELDPQKGVHVDVLSPQGDYLDRFWLPLPDLDHPKRLEPSKLGLSANRLAWIHQDEDENQVVTVYELNVN